MKRALYGVVTASLFSVMSPNLATRMTGTYVAAPGSCSFPGVKITVSDSSLEITRNDYGAPVKKIDLTQLDQTYDCTPQRSDNRTECKVYKTGRSFVFAHRECTIFCGFWHTDEEIELQNYNHMEWHMLGDGDRPCELNRL